MALSKSTITGRVPLPTDENLQFAELTFALSELDTEGASVLPGGVSTRAVLVGSDIPAGFELWQNTAGLRGTNYQVLARWTVKDRDGVRDQYADLGIIQVGSDPSYTLADLINNGVPPAIGTFWSAITQAQYDAVIQAAADAQASATAAAASAADAVNNAPFVVKDAATYFDLAGRVDGARYAAKDGSGAWDYSAGVSSPVVIGSDRSYSIRSLAKDPLAQDMSEILSDILSTGTLTNPVSVLGGPGDQILIAGHFHIGKYSNFDIGNTSSGGQINMATTGFITQDARSHARARIYATGVREEYAYALDSDYFTTVPGTGHYSTSFDISLLGSRSAGSKGLLIHAGETNSDMAWIKGRADIGEFDVGAWLETTHSSAYINENRWDFRIYDAKKYYTEQKTAGIEIDSNDLYLITQTGANGRAEYAYKSDATKSRVNMKIWDWATARIDPNFVGKPSVILTDKSMYQVGFVDATTVDAFARSPMHDAGFSNKLTVSSMRVQSGENRAQSVNPGRAAGNETDVLYDAGKRLTVTHDYAPGDAASMRYMFNRTMGGTTIPAFTGSKTLTVDLGRSIDGTQVFGVEVHFAGATLSADRGKVQVSNDGTTWGDILKFDNVDTDAGRCHRFTRFDDIGISTARYVRLVLENDTSRSVQISRFSLHASDWQGGGAPGSLAGDDARRGAYVLASNARMWGRLDLLSIVSGDTGGGETAAIFMNGIQIVTSTGGPRPTASRSATVGASALPFDNTFTAKLALTLGPFDDDANAATAGVAVGEVYRKTGGTLAWRQA